jgi:phenylpyruvate tautomerase
MPLLKLETNVVLAEDKQKTLLASLSKLVAETLCKPEQYVMVTADTAGLLMSGEPGEAAFVEVRSIGGLNGEVCRKLSEQICKSLSDSLSIPSNRIYLNFTDVDAGSWGWNGNTFG